MGLSGYALQNPLSINISNPASYISFDTTSFIFDAGFSSTSHTLKTDALSQKSNYTSLSHLLFGFSVSKRWRSCIGLIPYSQVGYKIIDSQTKTIQIATDSTLNINYENKYEGSGGINQVVFGNAFKINDNLSVGINTSFLFGTLERLSAIEFPDNTYFYHTRTRQDIYVEDFVFTYGLQYHKAFKNNYFVRAGAVYNFNTRLKATVDSLSERYTITSDVITVKDTITYRSVRSNIVFPQNVGLGFAVGKSDLWLLSAEYQWQNWNKYKSLGQKDSLSNSWRSAIGFQYCPKKLLFPVLFDRIQYRVGLHYAKTYLDLRNTQLEEIGVNAGIGLPLRKSKTMINLGFELGTYGTTSNSLMQDNYFKIAVGVSLFERWFVKSKYD